MQRSLAVALIALTCTVTPFADYYHATKTAG